jgi:large subunit ribosomal protein L24
MPTKEHLKHLASLPKLKFRAGDKVVIISGKDKGQVGYIASVDPKKQKAYVLQDNPENPDLPLPLNSVVKHKKAKFQGEKSSRFKMPSPIHVSNLMVLDPDKNDPTRVGRRLEKGKMVRYAKKTGKTIKDEANIEEKKK